VLSVIPHSVFVGRRTNFCDGRVRHTDHCLGFVWVSLEPHALKEIDNHISCWSALASFLYRCPLLA
jgi:hypothetical protein